MNLLLLGSRGAGLLEKLFIAPQVSASDFDSPEATSPSSFDVAVLAPSRQQLDEARQWCANHQASIVSLVVLPPKAPEDAVETMLAAGAADVLRARDASPAALEHVLRLSHKLMQERRLLLDARKDVQRIIAAHPAIGAAKALGAACGVPLPLQASLDDFFPAERKKHETFFSSSG